MRSEKFCNMGVRDPWCDLKSSIAQRRHTVMFMTQTLGCVIGVGIDLGFVAHWHLHYVIELVRA